MSSIRAWLLSIAFFYPIYWSSNFVVTAAPALFRVAVSGHEVRHFRVTFIGADVVTGLPPALVDRARRNPTRRERLVQVGAVILPLAGLLSLLARRQPALSGLGIAMLGNAELSRWTAELVFRRRISPEGVAGFLLFFAVLCLGLRWMAAGAIVRGYWARAGNAMAAFVVPMAALPFIFFGRGYPPRLLLASAAPAALASLLVSLRPRHAPGKPAQVGWKPVAIGAVVSLLLAAGVRQQMMASEGARLAAHRAVMASLPKIPADLPYTKLFFQKGVNLTAEFPSVYGSEGARKMLERLPQYGVNAVALVPYGFSPRNEPRVRFPGGWERDEGVAELAAIAHHLGMKVLLKPQLWVSPGYPGDLEFSSPQDRRKWFEQYRLFLEHYAGLATRIHADLLCVGVEFAKLAKYDAEWRGLIARARELYPGPLVYAANAGPEFEQITFWDALDYIGLNNYYPLPDDLSMEAIVQKVEVVQRKFQRPVLFTEAGYSSFEAPHRQPWDETARQLAPEEQARCYEAVFRAFYQKPWFQGVYWWKVGTNGDGGPQDGSHTPWGKPAMEVVKRWYLEGGR